VDERAAPPQDGWQAGPFEGRARYQDLLRQSLQRACADGVTELRCFHPGFADWPWSDVAVLDALRAWARPPRCLHLLAANYEELLRRHPRFVQWRARWGHCVQARAYEPDALAAAGPVAPAALLLARGPEGGFCLRLFETRSWRGILSLERAELVRAAEWFDAVEQRSCESFASTTLGL